MKMEMLLVSLGRTLSFMIALSCHLGYVRMLVVGNFIWIHRYDFESTCMALLHSIFANVFMGFCAHVQISWLMAILNWESKAFDGDL